MPDLFDHNEDERRLTRQTMARLLDTVSSGGQVFAEPPLEAIPTPGGLVLRLAERVPDVEVIELTGTGANQYGLMDALVRLVTPSFSWTTDNPGDPKSCPPTYRQVWALDANLRPLPDLSGAGMSGSGLSVTFPGSGLAGRFLGLRVGTFLGRDTYALVPVSGQASAGTVAYDLVTGVCPLFISGQSGAINGIKVEKTTFTFPNTVSKGAVKCYTNSIDCCPAPPITTSCCPSPTPASLVLTISGSTCACLNGTYTLAWGTIPSGFSHWRSSGSFPCGSKYLGWTFDCAGGPGNYYFTLSLCCQPAAGVGDPTYSIGSGSSGPPDSATLTCSPFFASGTCTIPSQFPFISGCCAIGDSFNWTVTQ